MRITAHLTTLALTISPLNSFTTSNLKIHRTQLSASSGDDEAQALLDKVAQIRAELAALEGKSVSQVESEAKQKKDREREQKLTKETNATSQTGTERSASRYYGTPSLPEDNQSQILQAAAAVERAYKDGINRQTVRFALVPEGDEMYTMQEWPGGAQQMSREAGVPLTEALMAELRLNATSSAGAAKVFKQDIWDFDGSALVTAEASSGPEGDVQALVLANTDVKYTRDIQTIDETMNERLFILVNPFWRDVTSWGINLLAPGAKKLAQEVIFDKGYNDTYAFHRFSVRGETCAALKVYPCKWQLFAYLEDGYWETPIRLGETDEEPGSAQFAELLNEREEFKLSKNMRMLQRMK